MKRICALLLALCLLPLGALAASLPALEGLDADQLTQLREAVDARLRLLQLPDAGGYLDVLDGEAYARDPQPRLQERVRLSGIILSVKQEAGGYLYTLSLDSKPERVFALRYAPAAGERLLLQGDAVQALGVFEGLLPFTGSDHPADGAPLVQADLIIPQAAQPAPLAAPPHQGSRADPAPLNVPATYAGSWWTDYASFEFVLTKSYRGNAALNKAKSLSPYNINPPRNQEYFVVELTVRALVAPAGRAPISPADFYFVNAQGAEYRQHFLINAPHELRTLYAGGEHSAILACLIDKGDLPLLVFQPGSDHPLWFDPNPAP